MTIKVSEQRWKEAHESEKKHWETVLSSKELTDREDGHYRHADVMYLDKDKPHAISVIDIGGGPLSLLRHYFVTDACVVDPIDISSKTRLEYNGRNISFVCDKAETFLASYTDKIYDEVWMYNCLQHTVDPIFILDNLWKVGRVLRISEPTNTPINTAHPHSFTPEWYYNKLHDISTAGIWNRVDYDYPYVGGKFILKRYD